MKLKPTAIEQVLGLNNAGFSYYDFGSHFRDSKKHADFYKGDKLTDAMRDSLRDQFGKWVTFGTSRPEYSPEQFSAVVIFLRAIQY